MKRNPASFRDPSGFVYESNGILLRAINESYKDDFDAFISSGLYGKLLGESLIVPFEEAEDSFDGAWKVIKPERISFISYPYEWSFGQLKDAALATLKIQLHALQMGMTLKDASAYNIQFLRGKPALIDHLSFECLKPGKPWIAYRQFVSHFLGPLALMAKSDTRHGLQLRNFIDGLPLDYISKSLPKSTWLNPSLLMHVHLHSTFQKKYSDTRSNDLKEAREKVKTKSVSLNTVENLVNSLKSAIEDLTLPALDTEWGNYYEDTNYTEKAFAYKKEAVSSIVARFKPRLACDLGANDGEFSRVLAKHSQEVISADIDQIAVHKNYQRVRKNSEKSIHPVLQDLCNPSPALGWANTERSSFVARANCDFVMGLALIHHLCIGNNVPLDFVAKFFRSISAVALIEFVPKGDSQVNRLLSAREDIFEDYSLENCINAFGKFYKTVERVEIAESSRTLLLFCD
jgi:hypothetical protein